MATNGPTLVEAVDRAISEKISPCFGALGAQHSRGESRFDGWRGPSSLRPRQYEEFGSRFFWWINRYTIGGTTFDIGYGDREFSIETTLYYSGMQGHFGPWELLTAAQVHTPHVLSGRAWVLTSCFASQVITQLAFGIKEFWSILGEPKPELIDRALVLRGRRMIFAQEQQKRRDRDHACIEASAAFHSSRYADAKRLLSEFENDPELPRSAAMILEFAKKRLG